MLGFETLTLCPIDTRLIDLAALSRDEIAWLDAYHAQVRDALSPHLDAQDRAWLDRATRPRGGCSVCEFTLGVRGGEGPPPPRGANHNGST